MTRYNVRCCCQPTKILGWINLPEGNFVMIYEMASVDFCAPAIHTYPVMPVQHRISVRTYIHEDGTRERAVYSEDRPIEFWRQVKGFHEAIETSNLVRPRAHLAALVASVDSREQLVQRPCGFDTPKD